ncbi:MAG: hypothetical protein ACXU85_23005 [Xanthobacteraceae bacterium]
MAVKDHQDLARAYDHDQRQRRDDRIFERAQLSFSSETNAHQLFPETITHRKSGHGTRHYRQADTGDGTHHPACACVVGAG